MVGRKTYTPHADPHQDPVRKQVSTGVGCKVLITTRFGNLAPQMHDSFYQHHATPLNAEDAWSLLKNQLPQSPNQVARLDLLKDVGMKITKRCGGLPLAIKIMGGLLRTKPQTNREWEAVLNHHAWSLDGLPEELDQQLYLSYDDLSPQLKQCFLYCSLIPKGTTIEEGSIIPMWISEGFVQIRDESIPPEEVAAEYYHELIMRNLIEPVSPFVTSHCTMHDVVHSFAEFMAREESLVLHDEQFATGGTIGLVRRLSVGSTKSVLEWDLLQKPESLRTLIISCRINFKPDAPAVKSVGPEFQASFPLAAGGGVAVTSAAFPNLTNLYLEDLCEWEDWEWDDTDGDLTAHTMAMPALMILTISKCKLSRLPAGLASSNRHALRTLYLFDLTNLTYVHNFPSVVELIVYNCPVLKRISGLSKLQDITITRCPNNEVLEGVPTLDKLCLEDATTETLPGYLERVNPRYFELTCCRELYESISLYSSEWNKIRHIRTLVIDYFDPDQNSWVQLPPVTSDPSASGVHLQQVMGSNQS
ncbi:hypothetical protein PR202_ga11388 [Eleusine coracana subsp. coracana]|uniref:Disease resistance protein winged helix domain-containing protein n=1 Tax=Eleusine coracana subsp. coracana TaxID=191504 RepID=A0AAV5C9D7_ELECO|nr:hypothetical protein PR202_ga11388 [Eleusine coracana subsp. coracana]